MFRAVVSSSLSTKQWTTNDSCGQSGLTSLVSCEFSKVEGERVWRLRGAARIVHPGTRRRWISVQDAFEQRFILDDHRYRQALALGRAICSCLVGDTNACDQSND